MKITRLFLPFAAVAMLAACSETSSVAGPEQLDLQPQDAKGYYEGQECDPNDIMPEGWSCVLEEGSLSRYCMIAN